MTVSVTVAGSASYSVPASAGVVPLPPAWPLQVSVANTAGDWMIACITWRQVNELWSFNVSFVPSANNFFIVTAAQSESIEVSQTFTDTLNAGVTFTVTNIIGEGADAYVYFTPDATTVMAYPDVVFQTGVTMSVADDVHNWWYPVGIPMGTSSSAGVTRCSIWAAPAARAANYVSVAPTEGYLGVSCLVFDVAGLSPWSTVVDTSTTYLNDNSAIGLTASAEGQECIALAVAGSDNVTAGIAPEAGDGWGTQYTVNSTNGVNTEDDIECDATWQISSGTTEIVWTADFNVDFCAIIATITVSGTPLIAGVYGPVYTTYYPGGGQSANWPYTIAEIGLGAGAGTPADQINWVSLSQPSSTRSRMLASQLTQGRQYTLDQLQTGQGTMVLDDPDQVLIPPGSGAFANGIDSGTPFRIRQAWTGGNWQVQFSGNGSTSSPQIDTESIFTVSPGSTYSASAWLGTSVEWADGLTVSIHWHTSGGSLISVTSSSSVTGPSAELAVANGIAPATAATANVIIAATGTPPASTVFYAAAAEPSTGWLVIPSTITWTAENGATSTSLGTWSRDRNGPPNITPWYISQAGYFQRWPPSWSADTYRGQVQATIADSWAYTNRQLKSCLRQEVLADGPYAYWPLSDSAGVLAASNIAPGNTNTLNVVQSREGGTSTNQAFGANSAGLPGDQVTTITTSSRSSSSPGMWQQAGSTGSTGYTLQCQDSRYPPISNGLTVSMWFQSTSAAPLDADAALIDLSGTQEILGLSLLSSTGDLTFSYYTAAGVHEVVGSLTGNVSTVAAMQLVTATFNQSSYSIFYNGSLATSGAFAADIVSQFSTVCFNGRVNRVETDAFYNGYVAHCSIHPYQVTPSRIAAWYAAGYYCYAPILNSEPEGELSTARVQRLLGYSGISGPRSIQTGPSVDAPSSAIQQPQMVSMQDIGGQPAATSLTNIAASTVPSLMYVAPTGDVVYTSKELVYNDAVKWVLGDDIAAGEIPIQGSYAPDYDPARTVNDIQLTQLDDQSVTVPQDSVLEINSINRYGDQSYQETGYVQPDLLTPPPYGGPSEQTLADWIAETNASPKLRVAQVTVDAASHPAAWPFVLQAAVGDVVTVNVRQVTAMSQLVSITGRITQTQRTLSFGPQVVGSIMCILDIAPDTAALTCDSPTLGQLNGQNVMVW